MISVVCALIVKNGKLLIVQHGPSSHSPGKWEFPGGKIRPGETPEEALVREIKEELDFEAEILMPLDPVIHAYPGKTIRLIPFLCRMKSGKISLNEHAGYQFVVFEDLFGFDLLAADYEMVMITRNYQKLSGIIMKEDEDSRTTG